MGDFPMKPLVPVEDASGEPARLRRYRLPKALGQGAKDYSDGYFDAMVDAPGGIEELSRDMLHAVQDVERMIEREIEAEEATLP